MNTFATYKIAGLKINMNSDNKYMRSRLKQFESDDPESPDIFAETQRCQYIEEPSGELVVDENVRWLRKSSGDSGFHVYRKNEQSNEVMAHMDINNDWSHNIIKCLNIKLKKEDAHAGMQDWMEYYSFMLMGIVFRNRLLNQDGIVMHASSIAWNNSGILFTAPSGTGKSTHVRLWEKYFADEIKVVNDDTPAIRFFDGTPMLCGTPWSGSSDKFENLQVPIKGIVVLEQAPQNRIRKLSQIEALPRIMPRVFLPYFDKELMEKAYNILEKIIMQVPIYLLECTPEKKAMELVYECMK